LAHILLNAVQRCLTDYQALSAPFFPFFSPNFPSGGKISNGVDNEVEIGRLDGRLEVEAEVSEDGEKGV
ncbi:hypothetical protein AKJ16_DCAP07054, partial [Drosera capensis]